MSVLLRELTALAEVGLVERDEPAAQVRLSAAGRQFRAALEQG